MGDSPKHPGRTETTTVIYYIVAKETTSHNEWIVNTWNNALNAAEQVEALRIEHAGEGVEYRIDALMSTAEEIAAAQKQMWKMQANAEFAKAKMDHEEGYPDSDNIRTKDFTIEELFTERAEGDYIASPCKECGALVIDTGFHDYTAKHVAWHNKLLP